MKPRKTNTQPKIVRGVKVPAVSVPKILEEFFVKDKGLTRNGLVRNSTILACKRDFLFLRGVKLDLPPYNLNKDQRDAIRSNLPSFAAILVFCSSIDLLARIMKRDMGIYKSRKYFLWSSKKWFNLSYSKRIALWKMRCAMSHQYKIERNQRAVPYGFPGSMTYDRNYKIWIFNLNGMFGDITRAINISKEYINSKSERTRQKYANFIYQNGFFYTHVEL